jgi:hypothetical protein
VLLCVVEAVVVAVEVIFEDCDVVTVDVKDVVTDVVPELDAELD